MLNISQIFKSNQNPLIMNRLTCIFLLVFFAVNIQAKNSYQTEQEKKQKVFYFSPSIGFGFFYPDEVNKYISSQYAETVNSDMYTNYNIGVYGSYFFSKYIEMQLGVETVGSSKFLIYEDGVDYYGLRRFTPNTKVNFHIQAGRKLSIILGGGLSYSFLRFKAPSETFRDKDFGFSIQSGVRIRFRKFAYAPTLVFNHIKSKADNITNSSAGISVPTNIDLSFIGVQVCNVFYF